MTELQTPIETLRQRLNGLLADWGAECSLVLRELEEKRARLQELDAGASGREQELKALSRRVEDQETLIETLRGDADEAAALRRKFQAAEIELERLRAELESKQDLIKAIRRDSDEAERLRKSLTLKSQQAAEDEAARREAEQRAEEVARELEALRERTSAEADGQSAQLQALRAELDARDRLMASLRADAERARTLEARLEERHEIIEKLEASINRHADTIVELRGHAERWKQRYRGAKDDASPATPSATGEPVRAEETSAAEDTSTTLPDVELPVAEITAAERQLDTARARRPLRAAAEEDVGEHTIAIDMRRSLSEARRAAALGSLPVAGGADEE